jgi:hypothetical protein
LLSDPYETNGQTALALFVVGCGKPIYRERVQWVCYLYSKSFGTIHRHFNFVSTENGPWSDSLDNILNSSSFADEGGITLSDEGRHLLDGLLEGLKEAGDYLGNAATLIRAMYDAMSDDEILLLMHMSYGCIAPGPRLSDMLARRDQIARSLYERHLITRGAFKSLSPKAFSGSKA